MPHPSYLIICLNQKKGQRSLTCRGRLLTRTDWDNDSRDVSYTKSCCAFDLLGFRVHTIPQFILYVTFLGLWRHHIYPFEANFVRVNSVDWQGKWRRSIPRGDVIPICGFCNGTVPSGCNSVTLLWHWSAILLPSGICPHLNLRQGPSPPWKHKIPYYRMQWNYPWVFH